MPKKVVLEIELSLTSDVYRRSAPNDEKPHLVVTTTLHRPKLATLELIGEFDSGTVLEDRFRALHFDFFDLTTGQQVINNNPFPGTCDPHADLRPRQVVELHASQPHTTSRLMEDVSPLSDPVRQLEVGHEYRIRLITQKIRCYESSIAEMFGDRQTVFLEDLPEPMGVVLASDDELILKIEE